MAFCSLKGLKAQSSLCSSYIGLVPSDSVNVSERIYTFITIDP